MYARRLLRAAIVSWVALASSASAQTLADRDTFALNGFYPLWENTGVVLGHGHVYAGTSNIEIGLFDRVQIGVRPVSYAFRAPNLHFKASLGERWHLAWSAQVESVLLLPGATEAFTSSNFVSRLDNLRSSLFLVPIQVTASWRYERLFALHVTATMMILGGQDLTQGQVTFGLSSVAELTPIDHHGLSLHVGEVGFYYHDFFDMGLSYRFHYAWFEARLGYFYRVTKDGNQGSPLLSLGVQL